MSFLKNLDWRFATKSFDTAKPVSEDDLQKILHAIRMVPTSYGLQPFHVYVVSNSELRAKMREHSYDQPQVTTSTYHLVFCARTDVMDRIDAFAEGVSGGDAEAKEKLSGMTDSMRSSFEGKSEEEVFAWASRQAYIALGFGLAACAELEIDSCPMEGFSNEEIDKLLELPSHMKSLVYLAIGYRAEDPKHPKFRYPEDDLFTFRS